MCHDPSVDRTAELEAQVAKLLAVIEDLKQGLAKSEARCAELEARLNTDSSNSHTPPSADPPNSNSARNRRKRRQRKASGRTRGGQPGRKGVTRQMLPINEVDHVEACRPESCAACGSGLLDASLEGRPERHQVVEIPPVKPVVTEYQLHTATCSKCGERNKASLPAGVSWSAFGPRVHALAAMLSGVYHVPRRRVRRIFADYFGLTVSLGAIIGMERRVSDAMAPAVDDAAQAVRQTSAPTGMDETGWRQAGERRWLWIAITEMLALFSIRQSRGGKVVTEMVGEQAGTRIVMCDRWSAYSKVPLERRQFCWAHLLRDFQKMAEARHAEAARVGRGLLRAAALVFRWWRRLCAGEITREHLQARIDALRRRLGELLKAGANCSHRKTKGTCGRLLKTETAMWTFVHHEGVEPTNNTAERAIRQAVIWRRISLGTQSDSGARFVERILSVAESLGLQGRGVFEFLQASIRAKFARQQGPSLVEASALAT